MRICRVDEIADLLIWMIPPIAGLRFASTADLLFYHSCDALALEITKAVTKSTYVSLCSFRSPFGYRRVKTHDGQTKTDKQQIIRVAFLSRFLDKNIYLKWRYI